MCREGRRLMKFVIQRVKEASVKVDGEYTGKIQKKKQINILEK